MNRNALAIIYDRLAETKTQYAECVKITRRDGVIYRLTAHDRDMLVQEDDGVRYTYQPADSFKLTALENTAGLVVTNMDLEAILSDETISENDVIAGIFDYAKVDLFIAFWRNVVTGTLPLRTGWFGEINTMEVEFRVDVRGLAQRLQNFFIQTTSLECRYDFCDSNCGLDAATFITNVTVSEVESKDTFLVTGIIPADYGTYQWGLATWTSGDNEGVSMEILRNFEDRLHLFLPMPYAIEVGDTIDILKGCDKRFTTCRDTYNNARVFGGEPFLQGDDVLSETPDYPKDEDGGGKKGGKGGLFKK